MEIIVHVKDKSYIIPCGKGNQRLEWLGNAAIFRYSHFVKPLNETTKAMRLENGTLLDLQSKVNETLKEGLHVWVIFKGDLDENAPVFDSKRLATSKTSLNGDSRIKTVKVSGKIRPQTAGIFRK